MSITNFRTTSFFYYFLAFASSLSTAGTSITLIGLSTNFYSVDHSGINSSYVSTLNYLGVAMVGLIGGWILQRFNAISLGIFNSLLSACITFYLASFKEIPVQTGLIAVFFIFLLNGIEHPNSLRFLNEVLSENTKIRFFSIKESMSYTLSILAPTIAALVISFYGLRICFIIDGITYLVSAFPWLILRNKNNKESPKTPQLNPEWFVGFKLIFTDSFIRNLNINRALNNLTYVMWTTSLPIFLAKLAQNADFFSQKQGIMMSFVSVGFIFGSFIGSTFSKKYPEIMTIMIWAASLLSVAAFFLLIGSIFYTETLYLSAFAIGIGTYCFRIGGMTLGQAFTPKDKLAAVIVAGDTLIRGWSFLISLITIVIFKPLETDVTFTISNLLIPIFISVFSLFAPFFTLDLARIFVERNKENVNQTS